MVAQIDQNALSRVETAEIPELSQPLNGNGAVRPSGEVKNGAVPPPSTVGHGEIHPANGSGTAVGTPRQPIRILIGDDDRSESTALHWGLSQRMLVELVGVARDGAECLNLIRRSGPDVVLLKDTIQIVDCLKVAETVATELPEVAVILMTTGWIRVDTRWRDMLQAGIAGVVTYPPSIASTIEQIEHAVEHQRMLRSRLALKTVAAPAPDEHSLTHRIVACSGPRGGCGRSLLACNLAVSLAANKGSVCLVDLNSDGGDIASLLDIQPNYSVGDLALAAEDIERDMIGSVLMRHDTGVNVIPAPRPGTLQHDSLTPYFIHRLLNFIREQHDFTIIDAPPGLNGSARAIFGVADEIVAMIGFDLIRLQQGAAFITDLKQDGIDEGRITAVLVCESDLPAIQVADAARILSSPIACVLPFDPSTAIESVNNGVPFVITAPNKPLSKAVRGMARRLSGSIRPPAPMPWWKRALLLSESSDEKS